MFYILVSGYKRYQMVFKTAAMGYPQINTTFRLKWLMMDKYIISW